MKIRALKANEIEARVARVTAKGCMLLVYKDARCDMNILDETFGSLFWKREHTRDNANCIVSVWNKDLKQWISKEDTGTQSFTEKEKGLASDSFKRACFNFGIGRELYTAPFIWFNMPTEKDGNKYKLPYGVNFTVTKIAVQDGVIIELEIKSNKNHSFSYKNKNVGVKEEIVEEVEEVIDSMDNSSNASRKKKQASKFMNDLLNLTENKPANNALVKKLLNGKKASEVPEKNHASFLKAVATALSMQTEEETYGHDGDIMEMGDK